MGHQATKDMFKRYVIRFEFDTILECFKTVERNY